MAENAKQMRERHKEELEELQENCSHSEISDWMPYYWAPAHRGPDVKVCKFCGKIMAGFVEPLESVCFKKAEIKP